MENWKTRWEFLAVSNIIPDPGLSTEQLTVKCGLCGVTMKLDHRGGLCTGPSDSAVVCDQCGDAQAPGEMALVRQLRTTGAFTVTLDGADPELDPFAWTCPICEADQTKPEGWHVVDTANGRPVCHACVRTLDAGLIALGVTLNQHEQQYQAKHKTVDGAGRREK